MKKIGRDHERLESLNLFSLLRTGDSGAVYEPANRQSFLSQVDSGLTRALQSESTLHGIRVQSLFEGMVASLEAVKLLKVEDAGTCYYRDDAIRIPDFRLIPLAEEQILIETKNHYSNDPMAPFRVRSTDLEELSRYAMLVGHPLKIAIYWAAWNQWTLNTPERFSRNGAYSEITIFQAAKQNEMATLGDFMIGAQYPLTLKFWAALDKPRSISEEGIASFHIRSADVWCGDTLIADKQERNVALYLMMYGKWEYDGGRVEVDESGLPLVAIHSVSPSEPTPEQGFEIIGSLSSLYSQLYNSLTLEAGKVAQLNVTDPLALAPIIPRDWTGKQLRLWRFLQQPNYD
jgi:hypothetical protein